MTQYARPSSDITTTGITGVGSATLWQNVDESSANDSDYNWSTINAVRTYECKLSSVSLGGSGSYVVKYRLVRVLSGGALDVDEDGNDFTVTVSLVQNTTVIASEVRNTSSFAPSGVWNEYTLTLTSPQVASITDGADLRLRFVTTASGGGGSSRAGMGVSFCEFAIPDAPVEQYAVKNGNYNDPTVWSTGAVPTTGAVYANGYTVTVNVNATCTSVNTIAGSVAVAGGGFTLANGVTLTANAYSGSTTCVTFSGTSGNSASFVGTAYGSSTTLNKWGIYNSSTGTLNITGSPTGGSQTNAYGAWSGSTGTINVTGSPVGGTGSGAAGVRAATGTINIIGSPTGGAATGGAGVYLTGSSGGTINGNPIGATGTGVWHSSSGTLAITGSVTGGTAGAASAGVLNDGSGTVTISGDATGGSNVLAYGASNTGTGTLTVATAISSAKAAGVHNGAAGGTLTVGSVVTDASGTSPCSGKIAVADLSTFTALVRSSSSSATLSAEVGLPSPFEPSPVFGGA